MTSPEERAALHRGPEWDTIAPHLPDPKLASPAQLETAADVLRARRFPEDALDYYGYAMARGGNVSNLLNKMGVVRLELRQTDLAHEMFQRTVHVQKHNAPAWNNLGVTEYSVKNFRAAISDYKRASKIDKTSAVYHSNLAMAYFESRDMESARREFAIALRIDPAIMHGGDNGGITAHIVGSENYGELCVEMARLYAHQGRFTDAILWLGKSAESGYNVREAMRGDSALYPLLKNPEVQIMLTNADGLRSGRSIAAANAPSLGSAPAPVKPSHITD
jgi:tetratricopeptide (TPR) repeat protein